MKAKIRLTAFFFVFGFLAFGQVDNWTVSENDFEYTMTFVGFVNVDGNTLSSTNDKVAAFSDGECRGVANLTYVDDVDGYYAYLTVFSNNSGETIGFKVFDAANNKVTTIEKTIEFQIDEHFGNLFQAYSFASPALNDEAEILNFGFSGVNSNDIVFDGTDITVYVNKGQNISALNAVFELSPGADSFVNQIELVSGDNVMDFGNPVLLQVRSEDQTRVKNWTISVKVPSGNVSYYKKDAVCYNGGAIKVMFSLEGASVVLLKENVELTTQTVNNGQVVFGGLDSGNYRVRVEGNVKDLNIKLKE